MGSGNVVLNLSRTEADTLAAELSAIASSGGWTEIDGADPVEIEEKIQRQL